MRLKLGLAATLAAAGVSGAAAQQPSPEPDEDVPYHEIVVAGRAGSANRRD